MKIETRGETTEINDYITQRAIKILEGAANMYDVTCEITLAGKAESGYSDKELSLLVKEASSEVPDITNTVEYTSLSGSEDATYMMNKVQQNKGKAVYLMFGTERTADHHNNGFDFNEEVLKVAVKVYMMTVLKLYEKEGN
ncbi:Indole-3-acetyl-aspartic acid hydrolase [bioreactor metagenome]|uniref:Indole-3-acetyl-aspartic acid hydrolase n=2 Tax=root TaxID=1 RepID=A0A645B4W8_9ZZZZ